MNSIVHFGDLKVKAAFERLKDSKVEGKLLHERIVKATQNLEENAFCGIQIRKRLIPKEYVRRFGIDNLWKYNLSADWRLLYTVKRDKVTVLSIILEWLPHKEYEKRFRY